MKTLLLTLGLGLIAALQAQALPTSDGDNQKVSGTWYLKAIVGDKQIPKKLASVSVTPLSVKTLEGGSLEVNFTVPFGAQCREISTVLEKTEEPGKYTAYGGNHVVYIVESQVEDHYILYSEDQHYWRRVRMAKLLGRDPEVNQEALKDFETASVAIGFNSKNIFIPKQMEACSPESN